MWRTKRSLGDEQKMTSFHTYDTTLSLEELWIIERPDSVKHVNRLLNHFCLSHLTPYYVDQSLECKKKTQSVQLTTSIPPNWMVDWKIDEKKSIGKKMKLFLKIGRHAEQCYDAHDGCLGEWADDRGLQELEAVYDGAI